ncbi:hypothetical protein ACHAWX_001575 [Stephanocyclus meneghinianus]
MSIQASASEAVANLTAMGNLREKTNLSSWDEKSLGDESIFIPNCGGHKYVFFIFPVLGLLVLFVGSWFLRYRRIQQTRQSARIYDARLRAHDEHARAKEDLRLKMIQNALVTTKVVMRKTHGRRSRSNSIESGATSLDFSSSTSCSQSSGESMFGSSCNHEDTQKMNADEGPQVFFSGTYSAAASQVLRSSSSASLTLEHPLEMQSSELESCAICLESYQENDSVSYSKHQNCTHAFHTKCILNWLKDECRNDCPYCRSPYIHLCIVESDDDIFADIAESSSHVRGGRADTNINSSTEQRIQESQSPWE